MARPHKATVWVPTVGMVVTYQGRSRHGIRNVRILAEASRERMYVEALGHQGVPVRFTVLTRNLIPLQPTLFD